MAASKKQMKSDFLFIIRKNSFLLCMVSRLLLLYSLSAACMQKLHFSILFYFYELSRFPQFLHYSMNGNVHNNIASRSHPAMSSSHNLEIPIKQQQRINSAQTSTQQKLNAIIKFQILHFTSFHCSGLRLFLASLHSVERSFTISLMFVVCFEDSTVSWLGEGEKK